MAYVSLYRKHRPQSFSDVVGQTHVTRTLVNALEEGRVHHAYLFTGPRGTGKTSTARILAKAVNCESGPTPTPCNACVHCRAITDGTSVDVIELDMASHGGVDDARELRDRALFAPASSRRKVYVLDEVHMASTAAFNALLKLIEEPPEHVLFAMATTDPQKVLPTILSRVQRLDLRRVAATEVADHVRHVCEVEGFAIEDGAIEAVVRAGDGSVRDTLSVLEQVLSFAGTEVTTAAVAQVLGHTPAERVFETVDLVAARDVAGLLAMVQGLLDEGHDLRRFTLDLVQHLRDLLVLQVAPDRPDLVDATDDRRTRLQAQSGTLPREALLRSVDLLAATLAEQRQGSPRLPLELALAKLAVPGAGGDLAELADRVGRLEQAGGRSTPAPGAASSDEVAGYEAGDDEIVDLTTAGEPAPAPETGTAIPEVSSPEPPDRPSVEQASVEQPAPDVAASADPVPDPAPDPAPGSEPAAAGDATPVADPEPEIDHAASADDAGGDDELAVLERHWPGILDLVKRRSRRCHAVFEPASPVGVSRGILTLHYPRRYASFHAQNATRGEYADALREAIEQACGLRLRLDVVVEGDDPRRRPVPPSVTPDDARTPVLDDDDPRPAADDEEAEVREAELSRPEGDAGAPEELLATELGAELIDERPSPRAGE